MPTFLFGTLLTLKFDLYLNRLEMKKTGARRNLLVDSYQFSDVAITD